LENIIANLLQTFSK